MNDELAAQILAKLDKLAGDVEGMRQREIQRQESEKVIQYQGAPARDDRGGPDVYTLFNPRTKQVYSQRVAAEMWRPDLIRSCACGQVKYAHTQQFVGEQALEQAARPVLDKETGQMLQQPWRPAIAADGTWLVPDELRLTDEKREHMAECEGAFGEQASRHFGAWSGEAVETQMKKNLAGGE